MQSVHTIPVKHVSHTAWLVAAFRAQESERPDAHFRDRLASKLLGGLEDEYLARLSKDLRTDPWLLTVRTCQIDQIILKAIQGGVRTILNLGAGLDTRPYRLSLPLGEFSKVSWFEADFPDMISYKNHQLRDETPACRLERIPANLSIQSERHKVLELLDQQEGPSLVLTEGLLGYLSEESVSQLAQELILTASCKYWLMDTFNRSIMEFFSKFWSYQPDQSEDRVQLGFIPEDTADFLAPFGWRVKEFLSFGKGAIELNRFPRGIDAQSFKDSKGILESGVCLFSSNKYLNLNGNPDLSRSDGSGRTLVRSEK